MAARPTPPHPSQIECPRCAAAAGDPCFPNGKYHDERIYAATVEP